MVLNTGLLDLESSTLTRPLRLTPGFPKCCIGKKRTIQYVVKKTGLVISLTMYWLASVHYLGFNIKLQFFFT